MAKHLSKCSRNHELMIRARRTGFVLPPRMAFPVLLVVVLVMFIVFASLDARDVSAARVVATAIVLTVILVVFGILALVSRVRPRNGEEENLS